MKAKIMMRTMTIMRSMPIDKKCYLFLSITLMILFSTLIFFQKGNLYSLPLGNYKIENISCMEDLESNRTLVSGYRAEIEKFDLTSAVAMDVDNLMRRELLITRKKAFLLIQSDKCLSTSSIKILKNKEYSVSFDFADVNTYSEGSCKFLKTHEGVVKDVSRYIPFGNGHRFMFYYWKTPAKSNVEWFPSSIGDKIFLKIWVHGNEFSSPCQDDSTIFWILTKIRK